MISFKRVIVVFIVVLIALCHQTEAVEKKGTYSYHLGDPSGYGVDREMSGRTFEKTKAN